LKSNDELEADDDVSMPLSHWSEPELFEFVSSDPSLMEGLNDGKHPELFVEVDELSDAILPLSHLACNRPGVFLNDRTVTVRLESSHFVNNLAALRRRLLIDSTLRDEIFCKSFEASLD